LHWGSVVALGVLLALPACRSSRATESLLQCTTIYGGTEVIHVIKATQDPYRTASINVEDRFEFKAVYVSQPLDVAAINLYVYHPSERGPALLHQSKYRPPYPRASVQGRFGFTGLQAVYDEDSRQLEYWCAFANLSGR
jgi:hypothetical protein